MMFRFLTILIVATLLTGSAAGEIIRFRLSGTIDVSDPFNVRPDGIESGMPFSGTFAYDLDAVDLLPDDPQRGRYEFGPHAGELGFFIRIGPHEFRTDPSLGFALDLGNDVLLGVSLGGEPIPPLGDFISGQIAGIFPFAVEFPRFRFHWQDLSLTGLIADELPTQFDPYVLTSVDRPTATLVINGFQIGTVTTGPRWFRIEAAIDALQPIPEPSAVTLMLVGLVSFGAGISAIHTLRIKKGVHNGMDGTNTSSNRCT